MFVVKGKETGILEKRLREDDGDWMSAKLSVGSVLLRIVVDPQSNPAKRD